MRKPQTWDTLKAEINQTLEREGMTVADLAEEIGSIYIVVYRWLKVENPTDKDRARTPNTTSTLRLIEWLEKHKNAASK